MATVSDVRVQSHGRHGEAVRQFSPVAVYVKCEWFLSNISRVTRPI